MTTLDIVAAVVLAVMFAGGLVLARVFQMNGKYVAHLKAYRGRLKERRARAPVDAEYAYLVMGYEPPMQLAEFERDWTVKRGFRSEATERGLCRATLGADSPSVETHGHATPLGVMDASQPERDDWSRKAPPPLTLVGNGLDPPIVIWTQEEDA